MKKYLLEDWKNLQVTIENLNSEITNSFEKAICLIVKALKTEKKILVFGNGGSASDAEHFAGEIVGRFGYDRNPLACLSLTCPTAVFTAISNDYGYEQVFKRQLLGLGKPGDVAIGITTSGNSTNVVLALEAAVNAGIHTIAMTGAKDSKVSQIANVVLRAPSEYTPRIQEIHGLMIHSLCRGIELEIFPKPENFYLPYKKLIENNEITNFAKAAAKYKIVFTNGCFDILHPGHVMLLKKARTLGDFLVLGLNTDESIRKIKGPSRPYHNLKDRIDVLSALSCVDYIIPFPEETPLNLIQQLCPTILVKGGDYASNSVVGAEWVLKHGGKVEIIPLKEGHSTSKILEKNLS
ncbi:MAG: D-glycero-beta-D-manno-heptose 1-phosphate adenylyltransferase [Candidatus Riflebacteria bacterium]|nr:D-glycero-beta-D-manno-heptose 1-phosphate adenylyltransferase [Candidatus Riflebacteria bacterium]